jgi:hypothetical protein
MMASVIQLFDTFIIQINGSNSGYRQPLFGAITTNIFPIPYGRILHAPLPVKERAGEWVKQKNIPFFWGVKERRSPSKSSL